MAVSDTAMVISNWSLGIMTLVDDWPLEIILTNVWSLEIMVIRGWSMGTNAIHDWSTGTMFISDWPLNIGSCNSVSLYTLVVVVSQLKMISQFIYLAVLMWPGEPYSVLNSCLKGFAQKVTKCSWQHWMCNHSKLWTVNQKQSLLFYDDIFLSWWEWPLLV